MCLITKRREPFLAQKDIKVYKVVRVANNEYYAPWAGCELTSFANSNSLSATKLYSNTKNYEINNEGVHAYTKYYKAKELLDHFNSRHDFTYIIITGTIPKGTYYWTDDVAQIAAKYIKWDKEYKPNWFKRLIHKIFK